MKDLSFEKKRRLMFMENEEGLRPLELAARTSTFLIFQQIIDLQHVYMHYRGRIGAHLVKWYDVTDYELSGSGDRIDRSPLKILTLLEKENLRKAKEDHLMQSPVMHKWMNTKIHTHIPYLVMWFLVRIVYTAFIFIGSTTDYEEKLKAIFGSSSDESTSPPEAEHMYDNSTAYPSNSSSFVDADYDNMTYIGTSAPTTWPLPSFDRIESQYQQKSSSHCPTRLFSVSEDADLILTIIVIGYSLCILLFDIIDLIIHFSYRRSRLARCYNPFGSKVFVVRTKFYRTCNFLLAASVLVFQSSRFVGKHVFSSKAYIIGNLLNIWSLLFFIQLLPAIGYFVTIIQRMMKDMFHFLILYFILFFSFSQTFYNLFVMNKRCTEEFQTVSWSLYRSVCHN